MTLLEKMRKVNKVLQTSSSNQISFLELSKSLSEVLDANVYILSRKGRILGFDLALKDECDFLQQEVSVDKKLPDEYNKRLLSMSEAVANTADEGTKCVFDENISCSKGTRYSTVVPVFGSGERLGSLVLGKYNEMFSEEDLILAEYGSTVVGMEILRAKHDEIEAEARKMAIVEMAVDTLSFSEQQAIKHIFEELKGARSGILIASKIADKAQITRSVIVNALRKLESAGVIDSQSLGMKGTRITVINEKLVEKVNSLQL